MINRAVSCCSLTLCCTCSRVLGAGNCCLIQISSQVSHAVLVQYLRLPHAWQWPQQGLISASSFRAAALLEAGGFAASRSWTACSLASSWGSTPGSAAAACSAADTRLARRATLMLSLEACDA